MNSCQWRVREAITTYISRLLALTNQMKTYGEEFSDQHKVEKVLRSLTPRFEHIVGAIEEAHDLSTMSIEALSGTLQAHEQRMNEKQIQTTIEQAFQSQLSAKTNAASEANKRDDNTHYRGRGQGRG